MCNTCSIAIPPPMFSVFQFHSISVHFFMCMEHVSSFAYFVSSFNFFHLRVSTCLCAWNVHHHPLFPPSIPFYFFLSGVSTYGTCIYQPCLFCFVFRIHSISSISECPLVYVHGTCIYQPSSFAYSVLSFNSIPYLPSQCPLVYVHRTCVYQLLSFAFCSSALYFNSSIHMRRMCISPYI